VRACGCAPPGSAINTAGNTAGHDKHDVVTSRDQHRAAGTRQAGRRVTMYAIVKTGGKQYKVAEGDVIEIEKLEGKPGAAVTLPAVLLVDGSTITTEVGALATVTVSGEVLAHTKGPKIVIHKFKNKTGYHKRQGHRQPLTQVKVTGISTGSSTPAG
jgi:large subunit ribosomal protein L21